MARRYITLRIRVKVLDLYNAKATLLNGFTDTNVLC